MFESALYNALMADATLATFISTFEGKPSIFSEMAPETATLPYVVFRIARYGTEAAAVQRFNVYVDIFGYDTSQKNVRKASEEIEFLLDRAKMNHERYGAIRLFLQSGESISDEDDPRSVHYNMLFEARAGRKKWSANITTLGY